MNLPLITVALVNFIIIGLLPRFFFRADGKFNLRWWATAAPFFAGPVLLVLGLFGILTPEYFDYQLAREILGGALFSGSLFLIGLTVGTNRVPLALWHQENDAPKNIVTYGAYRLIRHPFYSSFLTAMLGIALVFPHVLTGLLFLYMCFALNLTAAREERRLSESAFGKEYREYLARSGRFLPRLF